MLDPKNPFKSGGQIWEFFQLNQLIIIFNIKKHSPTPPKHGPNHLNINRIKQPNYYTKLFS